MKKKHVSVEVQYRVQFHLIEKLPGKWYDQISEIIPFGTSEIDLFAVNKLIEKMHLF